jgi:hypothetical protein
MSLRFAVACISFAIALAVAASFALSGRAADPVAPSAASITLHADKTPLSKVLEDLARQSGESVADRRGEPDVAVTLDVQKKTFWQALDETAQAADARVELHARDGRLALVKRSPTDEPPTVGYSGLFRTALRRLAASHDFETGRTAYTASLEVAWEPHLQPFLLETRPHNLAVHDEKGNELPAAAEGSSLAPVDGRNSLLIDVPLPALPRAAAALGLFQGDLYAVGPSKMLTVSFAPLDQLAKARTASPPLDSAKNGVACRITRATLDDDRWSVQVTLDYPDGNVKLDSYQSWVVNNEMWLESADGKERFTTDRYLMEESSPRHAVLTYHFTDREKMKKGPAAWTPVYRTPAAIVKIPFSFRFTNVKLP